MKYNFDLNIPSAQETAELARNHESYTLKASIEHVVKTVKEQAEKGLYEAAFPFASPEVLEILTETFEPKGYKVTTIKCFGKTTAVLISWS